MASAADDYRAFLREVIEVTRAATDVVDGNRELLEKVSAILEKCAEELNALKEEKKTANEIHRDRLRNEAQHSGKRLELVTKAISSPWFASAVPMILTWLLGGAFWYFGVPVPAPTQAPPAIPVPHEEIPDAGTP